MTQTTVFRAVLAVGILSAVFTGALPAAEESEGKLPVNTALRIRRPALPGTPSPVS